MFAEVNLNLLQFAGDEILLLDLLPQFFLHFLVFLPLVAVDLVILLVLRVLLSYPLQFRGQLLV